MGGILSKEVKILPGEGRADIAPPSGPIILKKFLFLFVISLIFNRGGKFPQGIQFLPGGGATFRPMILNFFICYL